MNRNKQLENLLRNYNRYTKVHKMCFYHLYALWKYFVTWREYFHDFRNIFKPNFT